MLFFYVRHGDPIYDPDSLTPLGHEQAKALAKRFVSYGLDQIYSSPSVRAQQTAQPTCDLLKKEKTVCPWACESVAWRYFSIDASTGIHTWCFYDPAILELFRSREVRALADKWYEHPAFAKYDFAEGVKYINEQVDAFFLSLGYRHDRENCRYEIVEPKHERVALFAHQGMGIAFFSSMLDIPYPEFSTHFDFGHSSMSVINFEQKGKYVYPKVLQVSNDAHLYRDGLMSGYGNIWKF